MLKTLELAGFRTYSPYRPQSIQFGTPITLISGDRGSGKSTLIDALRCITTGAYPPSSSKGKDFIMNPQFIKESGMNASIRLNFSTCVGQSVVGKRSLKLKPNGNGTSLHSVEQRVYTVQEKEGKPIIDIPLSCEQLQQVIPQLIGCSKFFLDKIVFCHPGELQWPFSDNATLSGFFQDLFQLGRYNSIIDAYQSSRNDLLKGSKLSKQEMVKRMSTQQKEQNIKALDQIKEAVQMAEKLHAEQQEAPFSHNHPQYQAVINEKHQMGQDIGRLKDQYANANRDHEEFRKRYRNVTNKYDNLAEMNKLKELQAKRQRLKTELLSLELQNYEDASKRTGDQTFQQKTLEVRKEEIRTKAEEAFRKYKSCFDQLYLYTKFYVIACQTIAKEIKKHCICLEAGIHDFVNTQLKEVNQQLAKICRVVYAGEDTLVKIEAAHVNNPKSRFTYQYVFLIEKEGMIIEMRKHCWDSQKVLLCIIIRLALAEVFGASILALDEPTRGLDRQQSENLARLLAQLVERNENKYRQMIIITRDRVLARMMEKYTPCYYEVSRDERRCALITKKGIKEIYAKVEQQ